MGISPPNWPRAPDRTAFVTELTTALVRTGMPRTAPGVLPCLFTSETGSHTAAELAQHLRVSAATISHAVAMLDEHGLIRRGRDGRRHRYFLDENAGIRSAVAGVRANQRLAATVLRRAGVFAETTVGTRLATAGWFLEQFGNDVRRAAERRARAGTEHTTR